MVILINFNPNPFKVEYTNGNKSFYKTLPSNAIVAMKDLVAISQIANRNFLVEKEVTIWEYETDTYLNRNASTPTTGTSLPLIFVGSNVKSTDYLTLNRGYSGTTTVTGMTISANNSTTSQVFDFITSASTTMVTTGATATTVGTSTRVAYSGAVSTATWLAAINATPFSGFGITVAGSTGSTLITSGAPITFYVSAHTVDVNSGYVYLSRLV